MCKNNNKQLAHGGKERRSHGVHACLCSFETVKGLWVVTVRKIGQRETDPHPNCDQHCATMPWSLGSREANKSFQGSHSGQPTLRRAEPGSEAEDRSACQGCCPRWASPRSRCPHGARPHLPQQNNVQTHRTSGGPWQSVELCCSTAAEAMESHSFKSLKQNYNRKPLSHTRHVTGRQT